MRSMFSKKTPIWRVENWHFNKLTKVKLGKLFWCSHLRKGWLSGCFFYDFDVPIWGMWNHRAHLVGSKDLLAWAVFSCRLVSTSHLLQILQDYTMERMLSCFDLFWCGGRLKHWPGWMRQQVAGETTREHIWNYFETLETLKSPGSTFGRNQEWGTARVSQVGLQCQCWLNITTHTS